MTYLILDSNSTVIYMAKTKPVEGENCITCGAYKFIQPDLKVVEVEDIPDYVQCQGYTYNEETKEFTERTLLLADYARKDEVAALAAEVADLKYVAIAISSFTHNKGKVEIGSTVTNVTLSWKTNKTPSKVSIDGEGITPTLTSKTYSGLSVTSENNKTWTLSVADERNTTKTSKTSITFYNGIYYGTSVRPETFDSAFVMGLQKKELTDKKVASISVDAKANEYIYYCLPKKLGECVFTVGVLPGGFHLKETIDFTNSFGYTEKYYIYESDNHSLGSLTASVK